LLASVASLAFGALALAGCNEDPGADSDIPDFKPAPAPPSEFSGAYPAGPYGVTAGSTIQNFKPAWQGYVDAVASHGTLQSIQLADFFNPDADDPTSPDRLYPEGSQYGAGTPKPRALLIDVASVWCAPCNQEAATELPARYAKYKDCGGQFLFLLAEGISAGSPPTVENLKAWTGQYKVNYPATIDPNRLLSALFGGGSYPDGAIIDTRTMRLVAVITGIPDDTYWKTFESLLDASCLAKH
jgi:hypothetical protein